MDLYLITVCIIFIFSFAVEDAEDNIVFEEGQGVRKKKFCRRFRILVEPGKFSGDDHQ